MSGPFCSQWQTGEPPRDERTVVVVGELTWEEQCVRDCKKMVRGFMRWSHSLGNWRHADGRPVCPSGDYTLVVHWWIETPTEEVPA